LHNLAYYHYEKTGQHQKAFELYHEALGRQDTNRLVLSLPYIKIAEHYERRGDFASAGDHLEKALAIFPEFERVQLRLAQARFMAGSLDKALAAIAPLVEKHPRSFDSRYLMAQVLLKLGRLEEALGQLQHAMLLAPDSDKAVFMMGIALNLKGDCQRAAGFLEKVLDRYPNDKHALLWMIDCHLQLADFAAAASYTQKFLEGSSKDRIENTIARTLEGGFMLEAGRERISRLIESQAHAGRVSEAGEVTGTDALTTREKGAG
jgi:tetratricopeptide (TPR) repeat protein